MPRFIKRLFEVSTAMLSSRPPGTNDGPRGRRANAIRGLTLGSKVGCKNKNFWIVVSVVFAAPQSAFACAACTGRSDDAAAYGLNAAVFTLLLVLLMVYGAIGCSLAYLIRRAAKHPLAQPDEQEEQLDAPHWGSSATASSGTTVNRVASLLSSLNRQSLQKYRKEWYENGRN